MKIQKENILKLPLHANIYLPNAVKNLILGWIFTLPLLVCGQGKSIPVNISLFNESTAIPFTRFFTTPVHPGFQVGVEKDYKITTHSRLFQTFNLSYFYHRHVVHGIGLNTELGYEFRMKQGLAFEGEFGLGYMHTFGAGEEFSFSNGNYVSKADLGNSRLFPSLSLGIGYYLQPDQRRCPEIFIRYQSWAEFPYSPGFIPVMTHINLHAGIRFFIVKKTKYND